MSNSYIHLWEIIVIVLIIMALSHKAWELPNSQIWSAEIDIDRGQDFPNVLKGFLKN